jgi:two-component system, cell cycle response regulator DivK
MRTILLVEDKNTNVSLIEDMFTFDHIPAKLVVVATGEEALQSAGSLLPVLILMDLRLPGVDGLETTQMLKRNPITIDIPVWAITAYAMSGDEERARAAGCCKYFTKPLSIRDFGDCLRDFLEELTEQKAGNKSWPKVLIVDDDANSRAVLCNALSGDTPPHE